MVVAVDLGYGWTKALAGGRVWTEPSVVGPATAVIEGLGRTPGMRIWDPDGQVYFVGHLAMRHCEILWHSLGDNKPGDPNSFRLLRAALAGVVPVANGTWAIDYLVSGLPVNLWAAQRAEMERLLLGLHNTPLRAQVDGHNIHVTVTLRAVRVLAQPYGSLLDLVLDDQGQLVRRDVVSGRTLVVDVGFHTVDLLAVDGLEVLGRLSTGTNYGVATAFAGVARQMNKTVWDVDQMVARGRLTGLEKALEALARNVAASVESLNERFDFYLVTGGGGRLLFPFLRLPGRSELAPDPQLGNVRGYWKAGERLRRLAASATA